MLSGPQDLLHLISPRRVSIYETCTGWKEMSRLKSRDVMEETLGRVKKSSCLKGLCHDSAHVWAVTVADCF